VVDGPGLEEVEEHGHGGVARVALHHHHLQTDDVEDYVAVEV
jgi:hypothetical protein